MSELVTNAVRAARVVADPAGSPPVRLRLTVWEQGAQVEVWDASDEMPHPGPAGPHDGTGGRGLLIVAARADRHGAYRTEGGGKCAWATISTATALPDARG